MAIGLLSRAINLVVGEQSVPLVVVANCLVLNLTWCPDDACRVLVFKMDTG